MVGRGGGAGGAGAFDYVQDPSPQSPSEGEEWYDTGNNSAYVYDGTAWIEQTIVDHDQLSGVEASDHHDKTTDHGELSGVGASDHHERLSLQTVDGSDSQTLTQDASSGPVTGTTDVIVGDFVWYSCRIEAHSVAEETGVSGDHVYTDIRLKVEYADGSTHQIASASADADGYDGSSGLDDTDTTEETLYSEDLAVHGKPERMFVEIEYSTTMGDGTTMTNDHEVNWSLAALV